MKFIAYGLNHTTAPIEVREKYALEQEKILEVLRALKPNASEGVFLSTCNRVEFLTYQEPALVDGVTADASAGADLGGCQSDIVVVVGGVAVGINAGEGTDDRALANGDAAAIV